MKTITRASGAFRWDGVPVLAYKEAGTHFRGITRQILHAGDEATGAELRYFEIEPGGHSTLERHEHAHVVLVIRGRGGCLVGDEVHDLDTHDVVFVPPVTWHQFRAHRGEALGFLCLVRCERDRPQRPSEDDLEVLRANAAIAAFVRV